MRDGEPVEAVHYRFLNMTGLRVGDKRRSPKEAHNFLSQ
jgi:hypothetical protein